MAQQVHSILSLENEAFRSYIFWTAVLGFKMLLMSILTARQRMSKKIFANPEDAALDKNGKVSFNDPDIERLRRAHLNDMENILPFMTIGLLYLLTSPTSFIAINLFRAVGISRIIHTLVYTIVVLPQPTRAIAFAIPFAATIFMAIQTALYFL